MVPYSAFTRPNENALEPGTEIEKKPENQTPSEPLKILPRENESQKAVNKEPERVVHLKAREIETPQISQKESQIGNNSLPLSETEIKEYTRFPIYTEVRWLAEWSLRQIKKLNPFSSRGEVASLNMVFFEVTTPRQNEIEIPAAEQMFANLAGLYRGGIFHFLKKQVFLSLEIVADPGEIRFVVGCPKEVKTFVEKQIHGSYPAAEIVEIPEYNPFKKEGYVSLAELVTTGPAYYSIQTYKEVEEKIDPLNNITSSLSKLNPNESAVIQIAISPAGPHWSQKGQRVVFKSKNVDPEKKQYVLDERIVEGINKKIAKLGFFAVVRIVSSSPDQNSAKIQAENIARSFEQFSVPHLASFRSKPIWVKKWFMHDFLYRHTPRFRHNTVLSTEELATIFHFPGKLTQTPNIKWMLAKTGAPPQNLPAEGLYIGISAYRGVQKAIHLKTDDRRRHLYVIGQTGTGKSEFLKMLARQDINEGRGLAFIDPHGDAVEDLLKTIPENRVDDVIYFDPGDTQRPPGLNILEAESEEGKHLAINSFIALLYKLYDPNRTGIMGPQLERAIRNVMLTAMSEPGNTMVEVLRLLTDPAFANSKLPLIADPLVKRYWTDELARTSDFHKSEKLGYFVSKFDRFVTEKLMRNIIGQSTSSFNLRGVMDQKKILLINLSKGKIGEENSNFLGLILVPRILIAAMSRVDQKEEERQDFYLYVDEFQNFATPDFVQILSEARKYRLSLQVANQFIGQLDDKIKDAVFGNVGTTVAFRVGADDAEYLEHQFEPLFNKSDLLNSPTGQAYMRLLIDGQPSIPFSMKVDWKVISAVRKNLELAEKIKEISRQRYGRDAKLVDEEIRIRSGL
ncbi:MAG: TraM recognition domain-containing protein [Patescibacteria group bacterium]|nr:TraM recognition domain-containing protein [Patescibacteria group bacterium]